MTPVLFRRFRYTLTTAVVVLVASSPVPAQENSDCLACHGDASLTTKRAGKTVSLFIDEHLFSSSVHAELTCITCHADLEEKEMPHEVPVAPVQCGTCHSGELELHRQSLHGQAIARGDPLAPNCQTCHGNHDIKKVHDPG